MRRWMLSKLLLKEQLWGGDLVPNGARLQKQPQRRQEQKLLEYDREVKKKNVN